MADHHRKLDLGDRPSESKRPSGWEYLSDGGMVRCVFSTVKKMKVGTGTTTNTEEGRALWFVEQVAAEKFEARKINRQNVPFGDPEAIPMHRLINEFTPEVAYFEDEVLPAMTALEEKLEKGDEHRANGRLYSAEMEYGDALEVDEQNVRALFGLGLIFADRKELDRTRELLGELIDVKSAFAGKNQHLFNEFGIALRKAGMFSEAAAYYSRALEFAQEDENLFYNLARSHYENGDWEACFDALAKSNQLNPDLQVVETLLQVIVALADDEKRLARYRKPPVPPEVAEQARKLLSLKTSRTALDETPVTPEETTDDKKEIGRARYGGKVVEDDLYGDLELPDLDALDDV